MAINATTRPTDPRPFGNRTDYAHDGLGRQVTTTDAESNKHVTEYDNADRVMTRVALDYDGSGYVTFKTAYEFDVLNRVTKTIGQGPDGDITATSDNLAVIVWYGPLGQATKTQDPGATQATTSYDGLGRGTRTTEDASGLARHTDLAFDRAGRLTRQSGYTDGTSGAQHTDYAHNAAGAQTRVTYPDDTGGDRGYVEFFYDTVLRLTKKTDQEALDTTFVYDSLGRPLTATKGTEIDSFAYGGIGGVTLSRRGTSGNPDAVSDVQRYHDGLGRLTRESQSVKETTARNVDYAYDKAGNVLTLTYPNGIAIETSYDGLNRRDIVQRDGSQLADYDYVGSGGGGRVKSLIYETGAQDVTFTPSYDGVARATRLATARNGTDIAAFNYSFDTASNITKKVFDHRDGDPSEDYTYDTLYRLTRTVYGQRTNDPYEGFVYDDLGNRLTLDDDGSATAYLYNEVNELTKQAATQVYYDKNGNLTKDAASGGGYAYFYDRQNQLTRIEDSSSNAVASYSYDAMGRRIEMVDEKASTTTRFYHDGLFPGGRVLEDIDASAVVQRYYAWGNYIDELLMMWREEGATDADYFVAHNHLSSPVALIDKSDASIIERYEYDAYGRAAILHADFSDDADGVSDVDLPYLFTGRRLDLLDNDSFRLMYHRARYYDPGTARWAQRDLWQYVDGMSLYEYVRSCPTLWSDPSGAEAMPPGVLGGGGPPTGWTRTVTKGPIFLSPGFNVMLSQVLPSVVPKDASEIWQIASCAGFVVGPDPADSTSCTIVRESSYLLDVWPITKAKKVGGQREVPDHVWWDPFGSATGKKNPNLTFPKNKTCLAVSVCTIDIGFGNPDNFMKTSSSRYLTAEDAKIMRGWMSQYKNNMMATYSILYTYVKKENCGCCPLLQLMLDVADLVTDVDGEHLYIGGAGHF